MKIIITEEQISEIKRTWMDQEYEELFDRTKKSVVKTIIAQIMSYNEDEDRIVLYSDDEGEHRIMDYRKKSKELYYDRNFFDMYYTALPHPYWFVNGQYYIYETFKELFPNISVNRVTSANM